MASVFRRLTRSRSSAVPDSPNGQGEANAKAAEGSEGAAAEGAAAEGAAAEGAAAEDEEYQMLIEMGFDRQRVTEALKASSGDMSEAVVALLSSSPSPDPAEQAALLRPGSTSTDQFSMEDLDAVLNEALKASEQEAEEERKRKEEEQSSLDAALAASLECMGTGPVQQGAPFQEQARSSSQSPSSSQPQRGRGSSKERSPADIHVKRRPLNDGELSEKVLQASSRRQQLEPLRPPHHREKEANSTSSPSSSSGHQGQLPQLQHLHRGSATKQHQQEREPRAGALDSRPLSSSTGVASNATASQTGEELVALDDLEGWNRGSGLFGVASLRSTYPARLLPVAVPRQQPSSMMPQRRMAGNGNDARPNSRAAKQGMGNSSSSPLLAAAALSIS